VITLLSIVVSCATALYLWHQWKPIGLRLLAVHEARYAPVALPSDGPAAPMPNDLAAMVNAMSSGIAGAGEADEMIRQQSMALLYEKCAEFGGDWDKVRSWSAVNLASDTRPDGWGHS
jgi:hypothetical protein